MANTQINSDPQVIDAPRSEVFDYLCDFNNIKNLLPEGKFSDWTATEDECSFKVQNAFHIPLKKESVEPTDRINIVSGEKAPFPFTLVIHLSDKGEQTEGCIAFDGEINAFLKMMVVGPLTNLFNYMASQLQKEFNKS